MRAKACLAGVVFLLAIPLLLIGCSGDGGDQPTAPTTDDCGYPVVQVPKGCDSCHGAPPENGRHPQNHRCFRCHGMVIGPDMTFVNAALHRDGKVEVSAGCASCHGWSLGTSPPQDLTGSCDPSRRGVGAHRAMRNGPIPVHRVNCSNCHVVPLTTAEAAHIDGDNRAEVTFGMLATAGGATPTWDGTRCSGTYCHGATLKGGQWTNPEWLDKTGKAGRCGACHWTLHPSGGEKCHTCHGTTVAEDGTILPNGTHLDGVLDLPGGTKGGGR